MTYAVGDTVIVLQPPKGEPTAMIRSYLGADARIVEMQENAKGKPLHRIVVLQGFPEPSFWVSEEMIRPDVSQEMLQAAVDRFKTDSVYEDDPAFFRDMAAAVYRAMRDARFAKPSGRR